jgi:hypothetical protein
MGLMAPSTNSEANRGKRSANPFPRPSAGLDESSRFINMSDGEMNLFSRFRLLVVYD